MYARCKQSPQKKTINHQENHVVTRKKTASPANKRRGAAHRTTPKPAPKTTDAVRPAVRELLAEVPKKPKKAKVVRDSFTMPKSEYHLIDDLKQRFQALALTVRKSQLLRAGLRLLGRLDDAKLAAEIAQLEDVKSGRVASTEPGKGGHENMKAKRRQ